MRWQNTALAFALAVVAGFSLTRCGGDGGTGSGVCSTDAECGSGKVCHQTAKVCVQTCNSGSDCPSTAKTCDTAPWAKSGSGADGGTGVKICQCSTDQLCGGGNTICSTADKICVTKCASSGDC